MARKRMVTRTVKFEKVTALAVDMNTRETREVVCQITGKWKNPEDLLKKVKKSIDSEDVKAVSIIAHEPVEMLMGMTEDEFIELARYIEKNTDQAEE